MDKSFFAYLKENKKTAKLLGFLLVGILLLLVAAPLFEKEETTVSEQTLTEYKKELEGEIAELCSSVEGVGRCRVKVTFERGAENSYKGSHLTESKPPKVMGIAVVCRGADSDAVRADVARMLSALFEIGSNRIAVLKLNS